MVRAKLVKHLLAFVVRLHKEDFFPRITPLIKILQGFICHLKYLTKDFFVYIAGTFRVTYY